MTKNVSWLSAALISFLLASTTFAQVIGTDGHADRVLVSNAGGTARWSVDASAATEFGDGVEDAAVLFGDFSDIHFLGDMNGDGLVDKVRVSDAGGSWRVGWDLSTPTTFGDGVEDSGAFLFGAPGTHMPVAMADINGDGTDEFIVTDITGGSATSWLAGDATGLTDSSLFGAPSHAFQAMGDVNGDGLDDRVIDLGGFTWHANFGFGTPPNGQFGFGTLDAGGLFGGAGSVSELGDLNNDGLADRVVVHNISSGGSSWEGIFTDAGGVFTSGATEFFQPSIFGVLGDEFLLGDVIDLAGIVAIPGDFDGDLDVDNNDLVNNWQVGFGTAFGAAISDGDADLDADVDGADFLIWQQNYTGSLPLLGGAVASIPEPSSLATILLGLIGMLLFNRKKHYVTYQ